MLAVVVYFIVVFLYCVCVLFVCNVCYLSVLLLYYCHRAKAQVQFNKYIYIYIYIRRLTQATAVFPNLLHASASRGTYTDSGITNCAT
jgi:hypothetical protein